MAKRFSDTDKWKKNWFRKLSPLHKLFWEYLRDNCNHAGIWEVDFELAQFQIGAVLDPKKIFNDFQKQILIVPGDKKWFIVDFIEYQYGCTINNLNPSNKVHKSILLLLNKYKIKGLTSPIHTVLDKDKDKDKAVKILKKKLENFNPTDIISFFNDEDLQLAWNEHKKVRSKKKGALTERADIHILNQLKALSKGSKNLTIALLDQSARKGWIDIFELKETQKPTKKLIAHLYRCRCGAEITPRKSKDVDDAFPYRCAEPGCKKVQLGKHGEKMVGYPLEYIEPIYKDIS